MNSRSSVNESNLVNFSGELPKINQLDSKDRLLSFPFDHLYACQTQSSERRQPLQLEKEVEISTYCVTVEDKSSHTSTPEISKLTEQLSIAVSQNKKLKDLLVYHLDLIQQQNELITKRDKLYHALKQENDTLKSSLVHSVRSRAFNPSKHPPNLLSGPTATITSGSLSNEPVNLASFTELLTPGQREPMTHKIFGIARINPEPVAESSKSSGNKKAAPPANKKKNPAKTKMIETKRSTKKEPKTDHSDPPYTVTSKSETPITQKSPRKRRRASGSTSASRNKKAKVEATATETTSKIKAEVEPPVKEKKYTLNKKSKTANTYGKSKTTMPKKTTQFTGSLADRLRLIDTTPTGEDPYQLGEADMREQSPIPKLMLQKTNHGRMKIRSDDTTKRIFNLQDSKKKVNRFMAAYDVPAKADKTLIVVEPDLDIVKTETEINWSAYDKPVNELNLQNDLHLENELNLQNDMNLQNDLNLQTDLNVHNHLNIQNEIHLLNHLQNDMNLQNNVNIQNDVNLLNNVNFQNDVNIQNDINLQTDLNLQAGLNLQTDLTLQNDLNLQNTTVNENDSNSLCDFSFGEGSNNLDSIIPSLDANEFQDLFTSDSVLNLDTLNTLDFSTREVSENMAPEKIFPEKVIPQPKKTKKRNNRTTSLVNPGEGSSVQKKRGKESRRGRKRAASTTGLSKQTQKKPAKPKAPRGKAAARGKKPLTPGLMTNKPYSTLVGDPDVSWYLGMDPDMKSEDVDPPTDNKASTVEVPRWREKTYTSCYSMEGTENLDDKVFEKRHQKLEAEERRQLRWHMRLMREQRQVEHLRQRLKDPHSSTVTVPPVYSVWQRPLRDAQSIEITDILPVNAFGEPLPDLPKCDFKLPWVKTPKAQKKSKRSKTVL